MLKAETPQFRLPLEGKLSAALPLTDEVEIMNATNNPKLTPFARHLRKKMTKEERHLWYDFLKQLPVVFHRQKVIGNYIVDFYCASAKLVIELDGSQHYLAKGKKSDSKREEYLAGHGLRVLRYSNTEINQSFEAVCQDIIKQLEC